MEHSFSKLFSSLFKASWLSTEHKFSKADKPKHNSKSTSRGGKGLLFFNSLINVREKKGLYRIRYLQNEDKHQLGFLLIVYLNMKSLSSSVFAYSV